MRAAWISLARRTEELGYSTLLLPDRVIMDITPLSALAVAVTATTTLRVGSYVFSNDYRHPALLAKEIATLHLLSEGRVEFGLGAGAGATDYQQIGLAFDSAGTRVSRIEEALQLTRQLFSEEQVNFQGKHYTLTDMKGTPLPAQPPILVAGIQKRILSLAAQYADIVAVAFRPPTNDPTKTDVSLEQKITWIREAAGERFAQLELAQTLYTIEVNDSPVGVTFPPGVPVFPLQKMSKTQAVEHLIELRERHGLSYFQLFEGQRENFAPVVAQLAGK